MAGKEHKKKNWIDERRSMLFKEIVRQTLAAKVIFDELYEEYRSSGKFSFEKLDRWIGTETNRGSLWSLKEDCHLLFRNNASSSFYERIFDWTLGSIFHEGMKFKENVYLLEVYQEEGRSFTEIQAIPEDVDVHDVIKEYEFTFGKAKDSAADEVESLRYLFSKAMDQLKLLISANRCDGLLVRFLMDNQDLFDQAYGPGAFAALCASVYKHGLEEAYLLAAKHYRHGGWHGKALALLKKALEKNPQNEDLRAECEELEKMLTEE